MTRESALSSIQIDDLFHADCPNGPSMICLTLDVTQHTITCRTVTTHVEVAFDRKTGKGSYGRSPAFIDSTARLPDEVREAMLSLDRKRLLLNPTVEQMRLTRAEIDGLLFVARFYPAHPLPEPDNT